MLRRLWCRIWRREPTIEWPDEFDRPVDRRSERLAIVGIITVAVTVLWWASGPTEHRRLLFVGNNLTIGNDLPGKFSQLVRAGQASFTVDITVQASPGALLAQHWKAPATRAVVTGKRWDYVVLQGQSSEPLNSPMLLFDAIANFAGVMAQNRSTNLILFGTWAHLERPDQAGPLVSVYKWAATRTAGALAPVGPAFIRAGQQMSMASLYEADGQRASRRGAWLAAMVLYAVAFNEKPVLPMSARLLDYDGVMAKLADIAWDTVRESGIPCSNTVPLPPK